MKEENHNEIRYPYRGLILRDYRESDIDEDLFWFSGYHPWMDWDAPWEGVETPDPTRFREDALALIAAKKSVPRWRLQIEAEGLRIGFVSSYRIGEDYGDVSAEDAKTVKWFRAVGIDILNDSCWGKGYGSLALAAWLRYLLEHGCKELYLQSWSGNHRMIHVAEKLGFRECNRQPGIREWQGKRYDALSFRLELPAFREATSSIAPLDDSTLDAAAELHSISWQASHEGICSPAFLAAHSPARQREYLRGKLQNGSRIFLLTDEIPVGLAAVTENRIEDLYVLPRLQGIGYGTALLRRAIRECPGTPTLWLLETNHRARRLYERLGFRPTGRVNQSSGPLAEIEFALTEDAGT